MYFRLNKVFRSIISSIKSVFSGATPIKFLEQNGAGENLTDFVELAGHSIGTFPRKNKNIKSASDFMDLVWALNGNLPTR